MKRRHVAAGLVAALPAAVLAAFTAYLMGGPEWVPWITLFVGYAFFSIGFLIIVDAFTAPRRPVETDGTVAALDMLRPPSDVPTVERRTFKPRPHFNAMPGELFPDVDDPTVVAEAYRGGHRAEVKR